MEVILKPELFSGGSYTVSYGRRTAEFTVIDEEFSGLNTLGRINRILIHVTEYDEAGKAVASSMGSAVIGLGNGVFGARSRDPELRGKALNKDNMERCIVELDE
jgi:hypothetical protein